MSGTLRCPFCVSLLPEESFLTQARALFSGKRVCGHCGRSFTRRLGRQLGLIYARILQEFEDRLARELKALPVADRAEVLVRFGLHMENAKSASVQVLLRSLAEQLHPQIASLARGHEGRLDIRRVERGNCACIDVDAMVQDGSLTSRRLRIARILPTSFIQVDMAQLAEPASRGQIAR